MTTPVLVLGAAGSFGANLVQAILGTDRPVVAVAPRRTDLEALVPRLPEGARVTTLVGSVENDGCARDLADALRALPQPPLQALVNLQQTCERGRLLDQAPGFLEHILHKELLPHLHAARHLLPLLGASGRCARYLVVGMPYAGTPWAGYGHYSVAAAAMRMLIQVLRQETSDGPVRVQQLVIGAPVRTEENTHCACEAWPDALAVARHAARVLTSAEDTAAFIEFASESGMPTSPQRDRRAIAARESSLRESTRVLADPDLKRT